MSDHYHQFLSSMGAGANPHPNHPDAVPPPLQHPGSVPLGPVPMVNPYQSLGYFTGFPEPILFNASKAHRSRRKSAPGLEHVKHRRTRSGCYTCRSRRVKCDEAHPVCERCRKGKRECLYPEPTPSRQSSGRGAKDASSSSQPASPDSSDDEEEEEMEQDTKLDTIPDEDEPEPRSLPPKAARSVRGPRRSSAASSLQRVATGSRQSSETPSMEGKGSSPSTSTAASCQTPATYQFPESQRLVGGTLSDWSHLPQELRFYLDYYCQNITHFHYCIVNDPDDFFQTILPGVAARNEALLYAVVGFAAYHHTLQDAQGKMQQFLQYYNKSVTLLLGSLKRKENPNLATLLTILQLATIEEYLGDWVNLMGHHRAAMELLTQLYTPQSAMQTVSSRMMLSWYTRNDVFIGQMGGLDTALPQEWFSTLIDHCGTQLAVDPSSVKWVMEECSARLRFISRDMSTLFGKGAKGDIDRDVFTAEYERIGRELRAWKDNRDAALTDQEYLLQDFSYATPLTPDDIINPYQLGVLYDEALFGTTLMNCEWYSMTIMHMLCMGAQDELQDELTTRAYAICQIFEAAEKWPSCPRGAIISIQSALATAALFLPRDDRHHMWMRRKFAVLESAGYIFPLTMRARMAQLFEDQSCVRWWLPEDAGFTPILKNIRTFADERNAMAVSGTAENLVEVRHVLSRMQLAGGDSGSQTGGESDHGSFHSLSRVSSSRGKGKNVIS